MTFITQMIGPPNSHHCFYITPRKSTIGPGRRVYPHCRHLARKNAFGEPILLRQIQLFVRTPRRVDVDALNLRKLQALSGPEERFQTTYSGKEQFISKLKKEAPIPELLLLKRGALVMLRKNDKSGLMRWVNGSLGHVLTISQSCLYIKLLNGKKIEIDPDNFTQLDPDGREVATARNFPVTLAWASTIHKSQGATIDRVMVDLSGLWEPGQAYVAMSRVKSADGLFIERWDPASILAEPLVLRWYEQMQNA